MIVKTFMGTHIDLEKIVSISDAFIIDKMGSGGLYVGFDIVVQLLNEPIRYSRSLERNIDYRFFVESDNPKHELIYGEDGITPVVVEKLQKQIDSLVALWKQSKEL
ncbi:hypothetical protein [Paenibacillus periandrae]|uniref:hypothetical protein n=1 Tax=Paenibacillus periandrae TaxID=1761741 RepID=UPI001F08E5ED|nr:hypothetical protein [Paenibacillus periandrae]